MGKVFLMCCLLALLSCSKTPKKDPEFKIEYCPEQKYCQVTDRTSELVIQYMGGDKALQRLRSMGVKNPNRINSKATTELVLITGKLNAGDKLPVSLQYIRTTGSQGKLKIPDGTVLEGECTNGNQLSFFRVKSTDLDSDDKSMILKSVGDSFSQFSFPTANLKIGEQFSVESSLLMPMEGSKVDIRITTTYKLTDIFNSIASFDVKQDYVMTPKLMDNSFHGTGSGHGKLVFDLKNSVVLSNLLNSEMELSKRLDSFDFSLKTKSSFSQSTKLLVK